MFDLSVSNLRLDSASGRCLLQVRDLELSRGKSLAIRGPSGAGKSTLLSALSGGLPVTGGRIQWGDTEITALNEEERASFRRDNIGVIFQDALLFEELSAAENAALTGLYAPRAARVALAATAKTALADLGVEADTRRTAEGYSGGERQRIAVARALASEPGIILADEPTASLDRDTADRLIKELVDQSRRLGRTLVVASHDPHLIAATDSVLTLDGGQVVQET